MAGQTKQKANVSVPMQRRCPPFRRRCGTLLLAPLPRPDGEQVRGGGEGEHGVRPAPGVARGRGVLGAGLLGHAATKYF